jgi:hypothetical protein
MHGAETTSATFQEQNLSPMAHYNRKFVETEMFKNAFDGIIGF